MKASAFLPLLFAAVLWAAPNTSMKLVWEDNFDKPEIDETKWNYTKGGTVRIQMDADKKNGILCLEVVPTDKPGYWRTGWINTSGKFSQTNGYFEASIRMLQSKGSPAFFGIRCANMSKIVAASMNFKSDGNDKLTPEMSIFDETGGHPLSPNKHKLQDFFQGGGSFKKFNKYGLYWSAKSYVWYVNDREVHRMERPAATSPVYLEFFRWLPEAGLMKEYPNPKLGPEPLQVDWVKIYK